MKNDSDSPETEQGKGCGAEATSSTEGRIPEYDILRAIACLLVVVGHACIQTPMQSFESILEPSDLINHLCSFIYAFHMPLFFMLSGACASLAPKAFTWKMLKKRFTRLLLPYFILGTLFILPVRYISFHEVTEPHQFTELLIDFLTFRVKWHTWFLPALFFVSLLTAIIHRITRDSVISKVTVVISALLFYFAFPRPEETNFVLIKSLYNDWLWYAIGLYFIPTLIQWKPNKHGTLLLLCCLFMALFVSSMALRIANIIGDEPLLYASRAMLGAISFIMLSKMISQRHWQNYSWMSLLVSASMSIYLYHYPFQWLIKSCATHFAWETHYVVVFFVGQIIAATLISVCCWKLVIRCNAFWKNALGG